MSTSNGSRIAVAICCVCFGFGISSDAGGTLYDRGGGLIYDDVLDVTWLQDANYAMTSGFDADGLMTWTIAKDWVDALAYFDSVRGVTWSDWRLPTQSPVDGTEVFNTMLSTDGSTDRGTARTTTDGTDGGWRWAGLTPVSEMGHMYYVNLANLGKCDPDLPWCTDQPGWGLANTGPFVNLQGFNYWTNVEYAPNPIFAWDFDFLSGSQDAHWKASVVAAWPVRDGDVPEPGALWQLGSGIGLLALLARRRHVSVDAATAAACELCSRPTGRHGGPRA